MRLIDVKTLELREFFKDIPPYAILSHTWGPRETEVTFQEYLLATQVTECGSSAHSSARSQAIKRKPGFTKITQACERAEADGHQYLWCDTNCIDKRSSAELSEAINSMYAWYRDSTVCYAFLADVDGTPGSFAKSRWFTRGWTLQELLAPSEVLFFDGHWRAIGNREDRATDICHITRIHIGVLQNPNTIREYSIAQRMSWAADRQTSRQEDIAYCLLGVFDVNMPLLYGEGRKAFLRLQQKIIQVTDDQSILAWDLEDRRSPYGTGVLAPSPNEFRSCGSIIRDPEADRKPYSLTNIGISVTLPAMNTKTPGSLLVELNCAREIKGPMDEMSGQRRSNQHHRQFSVWLVLVQSKDKNIYLKGHHPASKVFLDGMYPEAAHPKPTQLFLSTKMALPLWQPVVEDLVLPFQQSLPVMSAGPLITVASGDYAHNGQALREAYPFDRLHIVALKTRDESTSHHLISSGKFCVVISLLWDKNGRLEEPFTSILVDPKARCISQIAVSTEWPCLFDIHHLPRSGCCNTRRGLMSLHERLHQIQAIQVSSTQEQNEQPLVSVTDEPLRDLHGNPEVLIDIIFRERQRSHLITFS